MQQKIKELLDNDPKNPVLAKYEYIAKLVDKTITQLNANDILANDNAGNWELCRHIICGNIISIGEEKFVSIPSPNGPSIFINMANAGKPNTQFVYTGIESINYLSLTALSSQNIPQISTSVQYFINSRISSSQVNTLDNQPQLQITSSQPVPPVVLNVLFTMLTDADWQTLYGGGTIEKIVKGQKIIYSNYNPKTFDISFAVEDEVVTPQANNNAASGSMNIPKEFLPLSAVLNPTDFLSANEAINNIFKSTYSQLQDPQIAQLLVKNGFVTLTAPLPTGVNILPEDYSITYTLKDGILLASYADTNSTIRFL